MRRISSPVVGEKATLSVVPASSPLRELPDVFTYTEARHLGLSDRYLYRLRDLGEIEQLGRGLYRRPDMVADPDLLEIAHRAPDATLCLGTALARHGLSDEIPAVLAVALPRYRRPPKVTPPVRWHRFDPATFSIGRDRLAVGDLSMGIYNAERSICDAFRMHHVDGKEPAVESLKRWLRLRGSQPSSLLHMATHFGPRAETPIRETLQVLL
jgi:predicted transcriptional regulator of viral defense system